MAASYSKDVAPALEEAKQFLAGLIGCDGTPVKEIEKEAKEAGLSWATLRRAKAFAMNTGLAFAYRAPGAVPAEETLGPPHKLQGNTGG